MFDKRQELVSQRLRAAARGETCTLRIPDVCRNEIDTTVLMHPEGGGMGDKHSDEKGADGCGPCHAEYDRQHNYTVDLSHQALLHTRTDNLRDAVNILYRKMCFMEGHFETLDRWRMKGLVKWK